MEGEILEGGGSRVVFAGMLWRFASELSPCGPEERSKG